MKRFSASSVLVLLLGLLFHGNLLGQAQYSQSLLNQKRTFSRDAAQAIGREFVGIATSSGIRSGLFPIRATGVSTGAIVEAAAAFLDALSPMQLSRVHFHVEDPEWRNWSNVDVGIFARQGVSLEELGEGPKQAAWRLVEASLSARGLELVRNIMKSEETLLELNGEPIRYGEDKYYFTVMGIPSAEEPWGWQLDGHHLVINFFVLGDQVVMTPAFLGAEPVVTETGKYAGNVILKEEQDQGMAFMRALLPDQRAQAIVNPQKTGNVPQAAANQDNMVMDFQGLPGSGLTGAQRQQLLELIRLYVGNMNDRQADVHMDAIAGHLDETYFSWVGGVDEEAVFYYRIHSPVILIEFDHQNPVGTLQKNPPGRPTRDHIHVMVRTPNGNDYGKDLLRQHLAAHPH